MIHKNPDKFEVRVLDEGDIHIFWQYNGGASGAFTVSSDFAESIALKLMAAAKGSQALYLQHA